MVEGSVFGSGSSSGVERKLPKLDVAGSIPVSRSINLPTERAFIQAGQGTQKPDFGGRSGSRREASHRCQ